jgi:crotonobetainyl-CoA:carnitine CoA-transferase CaiB-like acyl-CoA transferase
MPGPLDGVKVVELTMFQQGLVCGTKLGDLGADVIKVEPITRDPARGFMRIIGAMVGLKGRNYYFENHNRNKRSIVLDLKTEKGIEVFLQTPAAVRREAPEFGQHTEEILLEMGYTWDDITKLKGEKVIP